MRHFACIIFKTSFLNVKLLRDDLEKASRRFTRAKKALQPDLWLFGRSFRSGVDLKRKWRGGNSHKTPVTAAEVSDLERAFNFSQSESAAACKEPR